MARKNQKDTGKPAEENPAEATSKANQPEAPTKKRWITPIIMEAMENAMLLFLVTLGLRRPNQGGNQQQPGETSEKQMPIWLMEAFPGMTHDDDDEYSQIKDSHPEPDAKTVAEEFEENLDKEGIYDPIRYIINLVGLRRRFIEQSKNPSPEAKQTERLSFQKITINDSAEAFLSELLAEKVTGDNAEGTVYERQKKRALRRNLLPKIHVLKKFRIEILIGTVMVPWAVIQFIIWILS
ncbi:MAG: hypothetical protein WA064_05375 [Candidatus Moraniibacteriota bacterium]